MEKEEIIERITKGESLSNSRDLLNWVRQSEKNQEEYIRYKNTWAILQTGEEMDPNDIQHDLKLIKKRISIKPVKTKLISLLKYAAIVVFALITGYFIRTFDQQDDHTLNEISVPNGNRSLIVLPDKSKVWLTNGSKLIYPNQFTGKTRNVKLEGEAFFSVTSDKSKPFIVSLGDHRIRVLGTRFSVLSYPSDNLIQVDLISGKIQMDIADGKEDGRFHPYTLQPMHRLILDKISGKLDDISIQDNFYTYWQNGIYEFSNELFESLAKRIERIYSVKIIFENSGARQYTFTGAFHIDSNIYTIMEIFKRASGKPFQYRIDGRVIYVN
jgi:ferric-dicitrate binding protein FerR (iron transport regulator)